MKSRSMAVVVAVLISSACLALLITGLELSHVEEAWNVVVVSGFVAFTRTTFFIVLAHVLLLGLPVFFFLRSKGRIGIVYCAPAGFVVAAVPFALLALTFYFGVDNASTGGKPTVIKGVPTLAGWIEYGRAVGFMGLLGLVGGLVFWLVVRFCGPALGDDKAQRSKPGPVLWSVFSLAVLATGTIVALPSVVWDKSCHNLFRDGRASIVPQIGADLKVSEDEWPVLSQMFIDFGARHNLALRSDEMVRRGDVLWRSLDLCSEAGITIHLGDNRWLAHTHSPVAEHATRIDVYELTSGSDWNALAREFLNEIEARWPQSMTFRGSRGNIISMQEALGGRE